MVLNNQIQGVIDWSSGRGGFAEEDFCPIEQGEWSSSHAIKKRSLPVMQASVHSSLSRVNATFTSEQSYWSDWVYR